MFVRVQQKVAKPIGFRGRLTARFMAIGHRAIYKNVI
jgi:hypothetical protein